MAIYERFEDLPVWQEAARLYNSALDLLQTQKLFLGPGWRCQFERAALSVSNNIAEGFERFTPSELRSFLVIARGSAGEVRFDGGSSCKTRGTPVARSSAPGDSKNSRRLCPAIGRMASDDR